VGEWARGRGEFLKKVWIRLDNSRLREIAGKEGGERMSPGVGTGVGPVGKVWIR